MGGGTECLERIRWKKGPVDAEHVAPKRQTRKRNNSSAQNGVPTDTPAPPKLGDANNSVVEVLTPALEDCPEPKRKRKTEEGQKTPEKRKTKETKESKDAENFYTKKTHWDTAET